MKNWMNFLGGSVAVYVVMAACATSTERSGRRNTPSSETSGGMTPSSGGVAMAAAAGSGIAYGDGGQATVVRGGNGSTNADDDAGLGGVIGEIIDPIDDAHAQEVSGSRLKAIYTVGDDGSKQFTLRWRDTKRNEDCSFARTAGGKYRCIPSTGAIPIYFADDACSVRIWSVAKSTACYSAAAAATKYGNEAGDSGCLEVIHTLASAHPSKVYSGTPAQCTAFDPPEVYDYFTTSGTVPLSEFVSGTDQTP